MFSLFKLEWRKSSSFRLTAIVLALVLTAFTKLIDSQVIEYSNEFFIAIPTMIIGLFATLLALLFIGTIFFVKDDLDNPNPMVMILPYTGFQVVVAKILVLMLNIGLIILVFAILNNSLLNSFSVVTLEQSRPIFERFLTTLVNALVLAFAISAGFLTLTAVKAKTGTTNLFIWIIVFVGLIAVSSIVLFVLNSYPLAFIPSEMTWYAKDAGMKIISRENIMLSIEYMPAGEVSYKYVNAISIIPTIILPVASFIFMVISGKLLDKKVNF